MRTLLKFFLPIVVLGAAALGAWKLYETRRQPQRKRPARSALPVEVVAVRPRTHRVWVYGMGSVIPAKKVTLRPQVSGIITWQDPRLVAGGRFRAGELLARIERADFELAVQQARTAVAQAEAELMLERGRQLIAEKEWGLLGADIPRSEASRDLALRKPQRAIAQARLEAARVRLAQAELNLKRTVIRAPFNAFVQEEAAELGQLVGPSTNLATLIGTDRFWVRTSVPVGRLAHIRVPRTPDEKGSPAVLIEVTGRGTAARRRGWVACLCGDMDPRSRLARVQIAVDDPLGIARPNRSPLLVGSYVRVQIEGPLLRNVIALPGKALREGRRVWVMNRKDELEIRTVKVVWGLRDDGEDEVLVRDGLAEGDRVITSLIAAPVPGMKLRVAAGPPAGRRRRAEDERR